MSARFVNIDHDTPMLLPPDLRDWVSPNHRVHFIMDAFKALLSSAFHQVLELAARQAKEQSTGKKPPGKAPTPPQKAHATRINTTTPTPKAAS